MSDASTTLVPTSIEMRAPKITREKMSRPTSSVPNQCAADGGIKRDGRLSAAGSCGASSGANIANCNISITDCDMTLGEKIRYLREVEGNLRGLGRSLTQQELLRGIKKEVGAAFSQSYLSQIESGRRPHMTNKSRMILAKFF